MSESASEGQRTYESATARLDQIIQRLDSGEAQLRETLELCEEAKGLIEYCAGELAAVDQGLKELKLEDLAASLTGTSVPAAAEPAPGNGPGGSTGPEDQPAPGDPDVPF